MPGIVNIGETEPRVITAMITPFDEEGALNRSGVEELAAYLVDHGSDALVLAGTTGESATLTHEEQLDLFDIVRGAVGAEVPLIGGTGSNSTAEAVELTQQATRRGSVNGILAVSPYYNRPSQYGIRDYYGELAQATDLPITLYNIPVRTGRAVDFATISQLSEEGKIAGLKDATGTTKTAALLAALNPELRIYSGDDAKNLQFMLEARAVGAISVASHWAGKEIGQLFDACQTGDLKRARQIEAALAASCTFESSHSDEEGVEHDVPNPAPTRVMMSQILGSAVIGEARPPMIISPDEQTYLEARAPVVRAELEAAVST